jgi:hypothetical protein
VADLFRHAAEQVDKILRGAKPADVPVEHPTKFDLVHNLKTAKALGLELSPTLIDNLCALSGYILNVALGSLRAVRQDQCRKITGPSDPALKRFEALWHGSNLRYDD